MDNQQLSFNVYQQQDVQNTSSNAATVADGGIAITEDESFSLSGYQVVRGEFFAHICEPSLTLSNNKIYVNTACIKKLPSVDYIQLLVNQTTKKIVVRPCREDVKDSLRWCSATAKRSPKQITAKIPFAMVFSLMNWNQNYRYKLLGKLIKFNDELLFVFDMTTPEIFVKSKNAAGKETTSRTPSFPDEWKNQFGIPVEEHHNMLQINLFDGYTVFSVKEETQRKFTPEEAPATSPHQNNESMENNEENAYEENNGAAAVNQSATNGND